MLPMIMNGNSEGNPNADAIFCKKLQFLFVSRAIKASLDPIINIDCSQMFRVDKRNWDTAFTPLLICKTQTTGSSMVIEDTEMYLYPEFESTQTEPVQTEVVGDMPETVTHKGKKKKAQVVIDPAELRRSTRTNRYDGFKPPSMNEGRQVKSKVKPRNIATTPDVKTSTSAIPADVPPPTPITTIQQIGTIKCGIPAEDPEASKLLASTGATPPSSP